MGITRPYLLLPCCMRLVTTMVCVISLYLSMNVKLVFIVMWQTFSQELNVSVIWEQTNNAIPNLYKFQWHCGTCDIHPDNFVTTFHMLCLYKYDFY